MSAIMHNLLKKHWSNKDIADMVGSYDEAFTGYAKSDRIRLGGASGGATSAIIAYAIDNKLADGALVCRTKLFEGKKVRTEFTIATSLSEVLFSQDSKYVQTRFVPDALKLIDEYDGRLIVVGLPCDLTFLTKRMQKAPRIAKKIQFTIGLYCGHNSQPKLIDRIVQQLCKKPNSILESYRFRIGNWRGYSLAKFDHDQVIEKKSSYFNLYQNLYFFCQKKCFYCHDHFAYNADLSVGDIWSYHLKNKNFKINSIISKNQKGTRILCGAHEKGYINLQKVSIEEILDGQARSGPTHNNTSAKNKAGRRFGMKIPDKHNKKVRWNEYMIAWIILFNYHWSMNKYFSKCIFKIPRPLLKAYLVLLKGLESIK
jgi:coenzyme F420-reducing hydrogenase beta subunit